MTPEGYRITKEALGIAPTGGKPSLWPRPEEGQDVRFTWFFTDNADVRRMHQTPGAIYLNRLTEAGLMERHGEQDMIITSLPAFRVVSIDADIVYLEDTNSVNY